MSTAVESGDDGRRDLISQEFWPHTGNAAKVLMFILAGTWYVVIPGQMPKLLGRSRKIAPPRGRLIAAFPHRAAPKQLPQSRLNTENEQA